MNTFSIKAKHFLAGESTLDYGDDRGFSYDSYNLNPLYHPGWMYGIGGNGDITGGILTDNPIGSCLDPAYLGNDLYLFGDGGRFYTLNGTTLVLKQTVAADTFQIGISDMIPFKGNIYATTLGRVVQLTNNFAAVDSSWWTGLDGTSPHPLERVEDKMYIGNLNVIEVYDGTNTSGTGATAITLPTNVNITSLRRHPDGKNLIAFCGQTVDASHTRPNGGMIYLVDTNLKQWTREIQINSQVEGSRLVEGVVYVTYGSNVGYFTGSGIKFLKKLKTSTTVWSQGISNIEGILLVTDGVNVKAFGDIGHGKVWWPLALGQANLKMVAGQGNGKFVFSYATNTIIQYDIAAISFLSQFTTNRYEFGREVMIKRIVLVHTATTAGTNRFILYFRDTEQNTSIMVDKTYSTAGIVRTVIETEQRADFAQFIFSGLNGFIGLKMLRVYYEAIE